MGTHSPAKITQQPPKEAEYVATVTVSQKERYRALREGNTGKTYGLCRFCFGNSAISD